MRRLMVLAVLATLASGCGSGPEVDPFDLVEPGAERLRSVIPDCPTLRDFSCRKPVISSNSKPAGTYW
jgi:hypothetical protein